MEKTLALQLRVLDHVYICEILHLLVQYSASGGSQLPPCILVVWLLPFG